MKKKKRVGILLGATNNEYPNSVLKELYKRFSEVDVDIHFFIGTETSSYSGAVYSKTKNCDYQYFRLYDLCNFEDLDLLIIAYGSIHIYHEKEPLEAFVSRFPKVPIIFLEDTIQYPNCVSIASNNYQGTAKCVEHLICEHQCKNIAFLAGPSDNRDSNERLRAYCDIMQAHGLSYSKDLIIYGDFSERVDSLVDALLNKNPNLDAIVSANDEMALSIYKVCERKGIQIGRDLLITGFDDIDMASYLNPPLTTVKQNVSALAQSTVYMAMDIFEGKPVKSTTINVNFIQRASCGCEQNSTSSTNQFSNNSAINNVAGTMVDLRDLQKNSWIGPSLLKEMISEIDNLQEAMLILGTELNNLGCLSSFICMFPTKYEYRPSDVYVRPSSMNVVMKQVHEIVSTYNLDESPIVTDGTLLDIIQTSDHQQSFISFLLFDGKMQYGMFTVEIDPKDISFYYTLSLHISAFFRFYEMNLQQKQYREDLKEMNNMLSFSATHDALTGLYNRKGALEFSENTLPTLLEKEIIFFIADVDHLKEINDTFGHNAGDYAIKVTAQLLNDIVKNAGIVARVGGDEFCGGFAIDKNADINEKIHEIKFNIKNAFNEFNNNSEKGFYIEPSVGFAKILERTNDGVQHAYIKADTNLYDAKKNRRNSIVK